LISDVERELRSALLPVFSFDANRGGEYETAYLRNHRAGALSDIELKKAESRDAQLQHKHPIDMGTAAVSHAQSMTFLNEQHKAEMDAIRREHEIVMTGQEAHAPANADQRDTLHLREWNLSALDGIKTQQNLDWIAARKTQVADRARETRSEEVRRRMDAEVNASRSHLDNVEKVELDHRERMMRHQEAHMVIEQEHTVDAVTAAHNAKMAELEAAHHKSLSDLSRNHSSQMIDISLKSTAEAPTSQAILGGLGPGPDRGFGVATQELCWNLGIPDQYTDKHNLHRKLETALRCLAAEQPADPCMRLAQLLL